MIQGAQRYKYYKAVDTINNTVPLRDVDDDKKVIVTKGLLVVPDSIMGETKYEVVSGINIDNVVDELKMSNEEMKKSIDEMKKSNDEMKKSIDEMKKSNDEMNSRLKKMETQVELFKSDMTSNSNLMRLAGESLIELSNRYRHI